MTNYEWLSKRTPRSVDELRLWEENPRLNPEDRHIYIADYADDFIADSGDKDSFLKLLKSITANGFIPADPIVVWQNNENGKFYVAEGNRRILALKLLRNPEKAPKSIRAYVRKCSEQVDAELIKKVLVSIAPSFDAAEWYINQRNSTSSIQRNWSRVQQQRWIKSLYEKYEGDISKILSITSIDQSEIEAHIRILKIKDYIKTPDVRAKLSEVEFYNANSHKFPITILERFFNYKEVKDRWGIEYDGVNVKINADLSSFYNAFAELIKRIVNDGEDRINTRMKAENADEILNSLPLVTLTPISDSNDACYGDDGIAAESDDVKGDSSETPIETPPPVRPQKNNPNRNRLVLSIYEINSTNTKLRRIFDELKRLPVASYPHATSSAMRIFLDLAILEYITAEGLETKINAKYSMVLRNVTLQKRIAFFKDEVLSGKEKIVAEQLLNPSNQFSLEVLNGYMHSNDTHYTNKQFLNQFWDFMFPLFEKLVEINEI